MRESRRGSLKIKWTDDEYFQCVTDLTRQSVGLRGLQGERVPALREYTVVTGGKLFDRHTG